MRDSMQGLTDTQTAHAAALISVVKARGLSKRAAVILIETALVETDLQNMANPAVPESMNIPHDAVGWDHDSVGLLQQRVPMWGDARTCMSPSGSAGLFLDALVRFDWRGMSTGDAAQTVQGSAFPDRYQQVEWWATQIVEHLWGIGSSIGVEEDMNAEQEAKLDQALAILRMVTGGRPEDARPGTQKIPSLGELNRRLIDIEGHLGMLKK